MAVTANQIINRREGCRQGYPCAAANLYEGTMAFLNASGYADDDTATGVNEFGGIVIAQKDNSAGSAGDLDVECWIEGVFELTGTGFAQSDVNSKAYATDNYTITTTSGGSGVLIGEIVEFVSTTRVKVKISVLLTEGVVTDAVTSQTITFNGATTANNVVVPINLADALSVKDATGDLLVFGTTTGATSVLHAADKLGFYDTTPATQPAHIADPAAMAAITAAALTDNGGGQAADGTIADIASADATETCDRSVIADAVKELSDQINKLIVDVTAAKAGIDANNAAIDSILAQLATLGLQAAS